MLASTTLSLAPSAFLAMTYWPGWLKASIHLGFSSLSRLGMLPNFLPESCLTSSSTLRSSVRSTPSALAGLFSTTVVVLNVRSLSSRAARDLASRRRAEQRARPGIARDAASRAPGLDAAPPPIRIAARCCAIAISFAGGVTPEGNQNPFWKHFFPFGNMS